MKIVNANNIVFDMFDGKRFDMKKILSILILVLVATLPSVAAAQTEDYSNTIQVFRSSSSVKPFFDSAYGYALFPVIGKAGFVIGGAYGKGQVYRHGEVTGTTTIIEGSIGWQVGGEAFSEIIFFQDERAYNEFTSGNFEFEVNVHAVAITAGAEAGAGTTGAHAGADAGPKTGVQAKTKYYKGMATFVHSKGGLMAGLTVGGQKFTFTPVKNRI